MSKIITGSYTDTKVVQPETYMVLTVF